MFGLACAAMAGAAMALASAARGQEAPRSPAGQSGGVEVQLGPPPAPSTGGSADAPSDRADTRSPQLVAATSDALQVLSRDILATRLAPDVTVGRLLAHTGGTNALLQRLQNAEQRGGTRWRNDETVEIILEVPGRDVADLVKKAADGDPDEVKRLLSLTSLDRALNDMRRRTFAAVGMSMGARELAGLRPPAHVAAWRTVSDKERINALLAAKQTAVTRVVRSLRPIDLGGDQTVGDALDKPGVGDKVRGWVGTRPVTTVEFRDNLDVRVALAAGPEELWPVLEQAMKAQHLGPAADDAKGWKRLEKQVLELMAPAVGTSTAVADKPAAAVGVAGPVGVPAPAAGPPLVPPIPPAWVVQQLDADGVARGGDVKTVGLAEADALANLRAQVNALPLGKLTLGDAAGRDPAVARAVNRAVNRAPPTKIDYGDRGTVRVRLTLDLQRLWEELNVAER